MDTGAWLPYVQSYGYVMLFLFLFCGIVGIPAPEESLLFFVGVVIAKNQLLLWPTLVSLGWNDGRHGGGVWRRQTVGVAACAKVWQVCRNYRRTVGAIPRLVLPLREMGHFVWLLCPGGAANMSVYGRGEPIPVSDVSFAGYAGDSWLGRSADIGWSIAWPTYPYPPDFFSACRFGIVFALFVGDMGWTAETQKIC